MSEADRANGQQEALSQRCVGNNKISENLGLCPKNAT